MKKFFPTLLLSCALAVPAAFCASSFEGKIHLQMSAGKSKDGPQEMDYRIKDGLVRIDIQNKEKGKPAGPAISMIMDAQKQEMIMLMAEQQMYMVRSMKTADTASTAAPQSGRDGTGAATDSSLEKTGEHEKILGYDTEKYVVKTKDGTNSMWLTSELGNFMGLGAGGGGGFGGGGGRRGGASQQAQQWEEALKGKNVFPLRVVGADTGGKETYRLEVTSVEKQSLPASDFVAPEGWTKIDMGNMMKGMIPGH